MPTTTASGRAAVSGLIITEEHSVHPTDHPYEKLIHAFNPAVIPGYRRITEMVHAEGVPILAQINHNGGQSSGMFTRLPAWAPSAIADPLFREVPKAVEHEDIQQIIDGYATVAGYTKRGGFDGVELQCSHSSIVRQFLSRSTNKRTDEYGGSLENRARLLREIIGAIRLAVGRDYVLSVRLCGDELIRDGITIEEAVDLARILERDRLIDCINTSIGTATQTLYMIEASMRIPPNYAMFIPSAIRKAVQPAGDRRGARQGPDPGRTHSVGRSRRSGRRRPGADRRSGVRPQGAREPDRRHPAVPVVQSGMRRPDGAEPLARLHRNARHRPGAGSTASAPCSGRRRRSG